MLTMYFNEIIHMIMPCVGSLQNNEIFRYHCACCLLWTIVCSEKSLVLDFVGVFAVVALIMPCIGSWQ